MDYHPSEKTLNKIQNWDVLKDIVGFLIMIESNHVYDSYLINKTVKDPYSRRLILEINFSTAGWSGNEDLVYSVLKNEMFKLICYYSWRKGGHYVFRIDPIAFGFKPIKQFCQEENISRQYVWRSEKFEKWTLPKRKTFVRTSIGLK